MISVPMFFKILTLIVLFAVAACCVFFYTGPVGGAAHAATPAMLSDACLMSIL